MEAVTSVEHFIQLGGRFELLQNGRSTPFRINPLCALTCEIDEIGLGHHQWTRYQDRFGPGVYAMFDAEQETILYIGMSRNLGRRLNVWFNGKGAPKINSWCPLPFFLLTVSLDDVPAASKLEKILIGQFDPLYNERLRRSEIEKWREREGNGSEGVQWKDGRMVYYVTT
jgi:hypothetical protein